MDQRMSSLRTLVSLAFAVPLSSIAVAQEAAPRAAVAQLPQQLVPTGEEDAARVATFAARATQSQTQTTEAKLRQMLSESTEGLTAVRKSNGAISLDLQGRFMSVAVAKQTEDGRYVMSCHTGEDAHAHVQHAADILTGKAQKLKPAAIAPVVVDHQPALEEK